MTVTQPLSGPPAKQRRRWPWFLLGLLLGGGGNESVRTVTNTTFETVYTQPAFVLEAVPGNPGNATGSIGIWDEGTESARHRIIIQSGTLEFTASEQLEEAPPAIGWVVAAEQNAPFTVTQADPVRDVATSSSTGRFAIALNRCVSTDERSWTLTIARTTVDGGFGPFAVVEVVVQCGHPLDGDTAVAVSS